MGPSVDSIVSDEALPAAADVVIIGGGIIGVSAALTLASRGIDVVLCEKGQIAGEQSSRNWGWCRQAGRDQREMPLIVQSLALWRDMNRVTDAETGFRECGCLYLGDTEADERRFVDWLAMAASHEIGARLVRGAELQALMPGASRTFRCGLHVASDGCAEPQRAAPAILRAAQRRGAKALTHCAVRGLDLAAGRVRGVQTERGAIACNAVILAGGAWSSLFCASLGVRLPQLKVLSSVMRTAPVAAGPASCGYLAEVGYRKRLDGGYTLAKGSGYIVPLVPDSCRYLREFLPTIAKEALALNPRLNGQSLFELRAPRRWALDRPSPFETMRVLDPAPNGRLNREAYDAMQALYPVFRGVPILREWGGYIDVTPDVIPYIDRIDAVPGLTVATGFSGHGFGIGPPSRAAGDTRHAVRRSDPVSLLAFQRWIADRARDRDLMARARSSAKSGESAY
jgi:glycine/D-amino acid oxidase-like deaminating enzyme